MNIEILLKVPIRRIKPCLD